MSSSVKKAFGIVCTIVLEVCKNEINMNNIFDLNTICNDWDGGMIYWQDRWM